MPHTTPQLPEQSPEMLRGAGPTQPTHSRTRSPARRRQQHYPCPRAPEGLPGPPPSPPPPPQPAVPRTASGKGRGRMAPAQWPQLPFPPSGVAAEAGVPRRPSLQPIDRAPISMSGSDEHRVPSADTETAVCASSAPQSPSHTLAKAAPSPPLSLHSRRISAPALPCSDFEADPERKKTASSALRSKSTPPAFAARPPPHGNAAGSSSQQRGCVFLQPICAEPRATDRSETDSPDPSLTEHPSSAQSGLVPVTVNVAAARPLDSADEAELPVALAPHTPSFGISAPLIRDASFTERVHSDSVLPRSAHHSPPQPRHPLEPLQLQVERAPCSSQPPSPQAAVLAAAPSRQHSLVALGDDVAKSADLREESLFPDNPTRHGEQLDAMPSVPAVTNSHVAANTVEQKLPLPGRKLPKLSED